MAEEILILHGWQNRRPEGHWQRWLAEELASRGVSVRYPQLPEPDAPVLDEWLDAVESELQATDAASLTVVAHSLGCLLWLAYLARRGERGEVGAVARRVVLVAPAAPDVLSGIPEIAAFARFGEPGALPVAHADAVLERGVVVASADDPFCPAGADIVYATPFDLDYVAVEDGGHLTMDDGYGPFPLVLELATR
ncbi:putative alpha/beta hydrolase family esterase [Agromyces sp. 3263]|uniref:RBBP9/YdeN family alpha/beta hydrolase n=1 Tax=Agromyces sp. 3263 TaxID=2817750 RepID=UPI002855CF79|nr:alpha/beta hydrolase [Agromyces sp. 3263]MDR6908072.1 putative alpha/beta hydrolase family esterase [Agromyces sp. 3263]